MLAASLVVQVMIAVLLSVVGALLILLHLRISQLKKAEHSFKLLSESLEGTITRARELMGQLKDDKGDSVTSAMQDQLKTANEAIQDLTLMSNRAEKILKKFDALEDGEKPAAKNGKTLNAKQANGTVTNGTNGASRKDPLATRPFSFTSQPLRTVTRGKSSSLYQAASTVTQTVDEPEEDVIKATRSEAEKRLKQALQGRI
ncbi:MAG: hypothetical protein OSB62_06220 [Alphaproteobacteria bacterium]|nr:hypothetical protein [Alphaproteobacteria bacterium]